MLKKIVGQKIGKHYFSSWVRIQGLRVLIFNYDPILLKNAGFKFQKRITCCLYFENRKPQVNKSLAYSYAL